MNQTQNPASNGHESLAPQANPISPLPHHFGSHQTPHEPWNLRFPKTEHYQRFKNLVELHELTHSWLQEVRLNRPEQLITRGIDSQIAENLWMLDSLSEKTLDDFLGEHSLDLMLKRLEHAVWTAQAWTLAKFTGQNETEAHSENGNTHNPVMMSILEQLCWKAGRACAEKRWPNLLPKETPSESSTLLLGGLNHLGEVILAFQDSPLSGYPHRQTFFIKRSVDSQVDVELVHCAHQVPYSEVQGFANALCHLHWHFLKGFAYALDPRIQSTYTPRSPVTPRSDLASSAPTKTTPSLKSAANHPGSHSRCSQTWSLTLTQASQLDSLRPNL